MIENLWLEVIRGNKKYIVGGIYRHPNQNIDEFNNLLDQSLSIIRNTKAPCIIAGDINIDLIRHSSHNSTADYVNNLLVNNFMPTIIMPTRITDSSATLVDHIYYCEGSNSKRDVNIKSGNLWCDLTDHLPNYILIVNKYITIKRNLACVRIFSDRNIDKFKKVKSEINWQQLYLLDNVNSANQYFEDLITRCYHSCFPLTKLSRKCSKDKMWITPGLKLSSKHKNKLYKKWLKSKTMKDELNYKNYRKLFKQIAAEAEQSYLNHHHHHDAKTAEVRCDDSP